MLRKKIHSNTTSITYNPNNEGESIENKVARIVYNNEPIKDGAPIIYMERKDGILPQYDVRTDRWEHALEAMDKVTKAKLAKRETKMQSSKGGGEADKAASTHGTETAPGAA